ncbi:fascin domain-containing protein, partial [Bacillus wiedmannii]|nr:hypothetical protein [Bacillus wiedmannii]
MKRFIAHANGNKIFKKLVLMVLPMVLMIMMITPSNDALAASQLNACSLKGVNLFNGSWTVAIQAANLQYVSAEPSGNVVANRTLIGAWEKFILYNGGDNRVYVLQAL